MQGSMEDSLERGLWRRSLCQRGREFYWRWGEWFVWLRHSRWNFSSRQCRYAWSG